MVLQHMAGNGLLDHGLKVRTMALPDALIDHDKPDIQYAKAGLDAQSIVKTALGALGLSESKARA